MTPPPSRDHLGRPVVAVTGIGLVTPLGFGVAESWSGLLAGRSGIRPITRFPLEHLKTTIAGYLDLPEDAEGEPLHATASRITTSNALTRSVATRRSRSASTS